MINIVCVKIGTKYSSKFANRLYNMCQTHITRPFKFFCYTDDPNGLDAGITPVSFVDNDIKIIVFNKLYLLSNEFASMIGNNDPCMFFDLDMVIKGNIDRLVDCATDYDGKLRVINAVWKYSFDEEEGMEAFNHHINSSCMVWKPTASNYIWEHFAKHKHHFQQKFHTGMDPFLYYEMQCRGGLPEDMFYSFIMGIDLKIKRMITDPADFYNVKNSIPIVLFNGPTTDEDIVEFIASDYKKEFDDFSFAEFLYGNQKKREQLNRQRKDKMDRRLAL
jgi:hypothetical protein